MDDPKEITTLQWVLLFWKDEDWGRSGRAAVCDGWGVMRHARHPPHRGLLVCVGLGGCGPWIDIRPRHRRERVRARAWIGHGQGWNLILARGRERAQAQTGMPRLELLRTAVFETGARFMPFLPDTILVQTGMGLFLD